MHPNVLKFVSIDGLSLFQEWNQSRMPDEWMYRVGAAWPLSPSSSLEGDFPLSPQIRKRAYFLHDHYIDETNGNRVFVYKERP